MEWISVEDRLPKSKGLYGITNKNQHNVKDFYLGYFDGVGFLLPQEIEGTYPYRSPRYWSVLEIGKDEGVKSA